ncbi:cytochrome P450 [Streptomyces sp. NPDC051572]|uniref:cytochrome P450 n=1 Tax=unclassified Streptomyces TaxID=2593676 RepID=UPI00344E8F07
MGQSAVNVDRPPSEAEPVPYPMPRAAGCPFDPPPALTTPAAQERMRKVRLWDGRWVWLVTKYSDVRMLFADKRVSHDTRHPSYPHESPGFKERATQGQSFVNMDSPEHQRLRRMVTAPFASRRVESMRPQIQESVDGLIDDLLAGSKPADLVEAFALPVPSLIICLLLGVPVEKQSFFQKTARIIISTDSPPDAVNTAQGALLDYLEGLVVEKMKHPGDDLLSDVAVKHVATGGITPREAAISGRLLLVGGHETTANMIALGTLALLQNPEQLAELRDTDDPKLLASAVEEMMRYLSIAHLAPRRFALEDIDMDGVMIRAGDGLALSIDAANRSPEEFPDPARLDLHRDARKHVGFGFGPHQCLGQPLARVELQIVYGTLYRRIPTLRLAIEPDQVDFKDEGIIYGVRSLPVAW